MRGEIGKAQMPRVPQIASGRRKNAEECIKLSQKNDWLEHHRENEECSWFSFYFCLTGQAIGRRGELMSDLAKGGVETRPVMAVNTTLQPVIKRLEHLISGRTKGNR